MAKIYSIQKPTQSGKTFEIIKRVINSNRISIIIVDDRLLETIQMKKRTILKGIKCFILSSASKNCKNKEKALKMLKSKKYQAMICCKNDTRLDDIDYILSKLNENINIYIDEADTKIDTIAKKVSILEKNENLKRIYFATATPNKVNQKFPLIEEIKTKSVDSKTYVSLKDCKFNEVRSKYELTTKGWVKCLLDEHIYYDTDNFLIPSGRTRKQHRTMKDMLLEIDFSVLIINGDGWVLYHNKECIIDDNKDVIPSERLSNIYKKYKLKNVPFAIVGELCIGRAITFVSKKFQFNHGLFAPIYDNDSDKAYQLVGRLTGNYKKYLKFVPEIWCTHKFHESVLDSESQVI